MLVRGLSSGSHLRPCWWNDNRTTLSECAPTVEKPAEMLYSVFKSVLMCCVKTHYTLGGMEMCVQICTDALHAWWHEDVCSSLYWCIVSRHITLLVALRCVFKSVLMHYTLGGIEMCVQADLHLLLLLRLLLYLFFICFHDRSIWCVFTDSVII